MLSFIYFNFFLYYLQLATFLTTNYSVRKNYQGKEEMPRDLDLTTSILVVYSF